MNVKAKKSDETRERIVRAFSQCVAENGYAQTKLLDIAEQAGLATPHLRYYFKNKESILEYQYEQVVARFHDRVTGIAATTARAWFDEFARLTFDTDPRAKQGRLMLMEANILVARSRHMKNLKRSYDEHMLSTLEAQFRQAGTKSPAEAATITFHFMSGLILNTAFESKAAWEDAVSIFNAFVKKLLASETTKKRGR